MASINDYLIKLEKLTQTNLDILKSLNDSFFTKNDHLSVDVGGVQYSIPSFISLENKVNYLQENLINLINSPTSGEAYFNLDGNSRSIVVRPYTTTPNSLVIDEVNEYEVVKKDIFKDFLYPNPYVKVNLKDIPNDITTVVVKKVCPKHPELVSLFSSKLQQIVEGSNGPEYINLTSISYNYKDLYKILTSYVQDVDYVEYDTKYDLPIRKNLGSGVYVISEVVSDVVDDNLDNIIVVRLRNDMEDSIYCNSLVYRLFDETIEKNLKAGDKLVTFDGTAKLEILDLNRLNNELTLRVVNGEYLNLVPSKSNDPQSIISLNKLRFQADIDFDKDKYVQIPLEEDQYVFISVAALNDNMNIQSSWGSGLMMNTYELKHSVNGVLFNEYYKSNVTNIGDVLLELSSLMPDSITKFGKDEFESIVNYKPTLNDKTLTVTQINKHLNDSASIQNIRALYAEKKNYKSKLDEVQAKINTLNENLANISFDDTTGIRTEYTSQITDLVKEKNELSTKITKTLDDIALAANNSETPIENAKYRIRGYYDFDNIPHAQSVIGIRVQYRYKNVSQEQGTAMSMNDHKFIFSDWINMNSFDREYIPVLSENGELYRVKLEDENNNLNVPSFNQLDIPISQGETVDIRLKVVYSYGYPFAQTSSQWSDIINIKFPEEYLKDVQILDIISENNDDIETNRFNNIIKGEGIIDHVNDKIQDQDILYYHKPDNISSGFYTQERRIIPLKDKLSELNNSIIELQDLVLGTQEDSLEVSIVNGEIDAELKPYQKNKIYVQAYDIINEGNDGIYVKENGWVTTTMNISIRNTSNHTIRLFSMFPGGKDTELHQSTYQSGLIRDEYQSLDEGTNVRAVWSYVPGLEDYISQKCNQYITFRLKDKYTSQPHYADNNSNDNSTLSWYSEKTSKTSADTGSGMFMYPTLSNQYSLSIDAPEIGGYMTLMPNSELLIPITCEYRIGEDDITEVNRTMSFELRPSLYKDPMVYSFTVYAKQESTSRDKVISYNRQTYAKNNLERMAKKYNVTVK